MIKLKKIDFEKYVRNILLFTDIKNKDILVHLIDIAFIENKNRPMKRFVLRNRLSQILARKFDKNIDTILQDILDEGIDNGKIVYNSKEETYTMSENQYNEVNVYMEHFSVLEDNFKNKFLNYIAKKSDAINDVCLKYISERVIDVIKKYLYNTGVAVFQKVMNFEDSMLIEDELKDVILEVYGNYNFNINVLAEIESLIKEYLMHINDEDIEYIIEILKKTLFLKLYSNINIKNNQEFLKGRVFYIDTNILIPLFFPNHLQSRVVKDIIRECGEQKIKLKVTTLTIDEYRRLFKYLRRIDKDFCSAGVYQHRRLLKNISKIDLDNVIYSYYLKNIGTYKDFGNFAKEFCDNLYYYLKLYNIEEEEVNDEILETIKKSNKHEEFVYKLFNIKDNDKEYISVNSIEHDVLMMEYINNFRNENDEIDELGHKIWFITRDKKLEKFRFDNRKEFYYPITMTVEELYDLLLPFYIERKEFTEEYIRHLINSKIGLYDYSEEKHVKLNVLNCIFNSGIDIKQLEGLSDNELLKLIYMIQSNRDVKQMCEKIDRNIEDDIKNKQENIEVEDELKENLKELVKQQLDLVKEKDIEMRMEQLAKELSQVKEENLELKKFVDKYNKLVEQNKNKTQTISSKKYIFKIVYTVYCKIKRLFKRFFRNESNY